MVVATGTSTATGLYRLELFIQATAAKDTRSRLMLNNVMRDVYFTCRGPLESGEKAFRFSVTSGYCSR